ncbi:FAD:protein FMN transferase [Lactococcus garvieae]|uniref:FAD:protein FMN transferase n=1 Tax=Lactococcus garvieae TaxID=1363 RepID=UPI0018D6E98A|nr:FAD:protein FMN transferase [Lactococcus garvieae]QPS71060.1 FAD:protein FMN transferase [Lactococcus garvieae]
MRTLELLKMNDFISRKYQGLGTVIELSVLRTDKVKDVEKLDQAYEEIKKYEDLFTVNKLYSEIIAVNQAAGVRAIPLSEDVYSLTKKAVQVSQEHFGFNASVGPLVDLWRIGFADARLPSDREIQEALRLISPDEIVLDDSKKSVFLPEKGMSLDLGGIAKGYIADKVATFWKNQGISTGVINLGGNVLFLGRFLTREWRVGIRNPLEKTKSLVLQVLTNSKSAVTSGINQRYLEIEGETYHHIINPETGYPHVNNLASVTIFSQTAVDGEIEAKRLFFAENPEEVFSINSSKIHGAILINKDREVKILGLKPKDVRLIDKSFKIIS